MFWADQTQAISFEEFKYFIQYSINKLNHSRISNAYFKWQPPQIAAAEIINLQMKNTYRLENRFLNNCFQTIRV